jgi:3-methyladenine DNA glycosylase AlkD
MTPAKSPTLEEVLSRLEAERDERGMARWGDGGIRTGGLRSFGIGLTRLRAIGKSIGRDRALAQALWHTDLHEARVLSLLIDDPAQITREQAEQQVEQVDAGQLAHVFASCDATLARTPFVVELADAWTRSNDPVRRDCAMACFTRYPSPAVARPRPTTGSLVTSIGLPPASTTSRNVSGWRWPPH